MLRDTGVVVQNIKHSVTRLRMRLDNGPFFFFFKGVKASTTNVKGK